MTQLSVSVSNNLVLADARITSSAPGHDIRTLVDPAAIEATLEH